MQPLPQKLQAAIYSLSRQFNYINNVLLNINFKEAPGLGTFGVDAYWRCQFDPACVEEWSIDSIKAVLFHEVNHLLRDHPTRSDPYEDKFKFNIAGDMEINPDVDAAGLKLPVEGVYPKSYKLPDNLLAEEYINKIPDPPKLYVSGGKGKDGKGKEKQPTVGSGHCGSCAGHAMEGEDEAPAEGEGLSNAEKELIKRQVAKEIENTVRQAGNVPAGLRRWAETLLHPQVKWTKELAALVRRSVMEVMGMQDRTYKKPSRIAGGLDQRVLLAGWKAYAPNVGLVFDTSGSMGETDLAKSLAECKGVLSALGGNAQVQYISVDCQPGKMKKVSSVKQVRLEGGGGTDMRLGIQAAIESKPRVDICIVLTDGFTPWPKEQPPFKTVVVLTQAGAQKEVPAWAKAILVN